MPPHFDVAYSVNTFEMVIQEIAITTDRASREALIAGAFGLGTRVLEVVIQALKKDPKVEHTLQGCSETTVQDVLDSREALQRFLSAEKVLLHLSGWHHSQISQVVKYIDDNFYKLQQPPHLKRLLKKLDCLKDEMDELSRNMHQAARRADWLQRLVPLSGGIALILVDIKAITLIGEAYAVVSAGIGVNIVSTEISELRHA